MLINFLGPYFRVLCIHNPRLPACTIDPAWHRCKSSWFMFCKLVFPGCSQFPDGEKWQSLCSADGLPAIAFSCIWHPRVGFSSRQPARSSSCILWTDPNLMVEHTRAEQKFHWHWSTAAGSVLKPAHLLPSLTLRCC